MSEVKAADELYKHQDGWIETQNGRFRLSDPTFDIRDIAHALSMNCRFNGHTREFYSVAEHSVMVSKIMERYSLGDPLEGLLHDATEAYLTDVPAPFKQYLADWKKIDADVDARLRESFRIGQKTAGCKEADWIALFIEAYHLLPSRGSAFADPANMRARALQLKEEFLVNCLSPQHAKAVFLARYQHLTVR